MFNRISQSISDEFFLKIKRIFPSLPNYKQLYYIICVLDKGTRLEDIPEMEIEIHQDDSIEYFVQKELVLFIMLDYEVKDSIFQLKQH
jgi:hypothetical protein